MKQSTIKINPELHRKLKLISVQNGIGLSKLIENILTKYTENRDENETTSKGLR
jgi:predicted HicB family RNase H-like nuclease